MSLQRHTNHDLPPLSDSRLNDSERRRGIPKVGGVAGDDALEAAGERGDENVSYRPLGCLRGSTAHLMVIPQTMCGFCVSHGPRLGCRDGYDLEEGVRGLWIAAERRSHFDKSHGANAQTVGEMLTSPELATAFRTNLIAPRLALIERIFRNAEARGEIAPGVDWQPYAFALLGSNIFRVAFMGERPDRAVNQRLIEMIALDATSGGASIRMIDV